MMNVGSIGVYGVLGIRKTDWNLRCIRSSIENISELFAIEKQLSRDVKECSACCCSISTISSRDGLLVAQHRQQLYLCSSSL